MDGWLGQTNGWINECMLLFSFISLAPVSVSITPSMLIHSSDQVSTINCSSTGVPAPTINFVDIQCAYSDTTNISKIVINNIYIILSFITKILINNIYIILSFIPLADIISGIFTVQCISKRENGLYKVTAVAKITTVAIGGPIELQCRARNALFNGSDTGTISIYGN